MNVSPPVTRVFGVDPGDSMGLFELLVPPGVGLLNPAVTIGLRVQDHPDTCLLHLSQQLHLAESDDERVVIAVERFTQLPNLSRMSSQPTAQRIYGVVQNLAEMYSNNVVFFSQTPGDAKKFASNAHLKQLGLYTLPRQVGQPDANDVNDAARHALLGLIKSRASVYDQLLRDSIPSQR